MPRKKIEVVELNKKEEKIILEENKSPLIAFFRHNRLLILLTTLILALTILIIGIVLVFKNLGHNDEMIIKQVSLDTTLEDYKARIVTGDNAITEDTAKDAFNKNELFKGSGEVLLVNKIETTDYIIKFYSDGTAIKIMKNINIATRINPLDNGDYGINKNGVINSKAIVSEVTKKDTKTYPWGTITYFSDGSADVSDSEMDLFVRDAKDINDNYISNNKVSYLKEIKTIGNNKLYYYYDGTIEIVNNNNSYLVRKESDILINGNNITFKNDNEAVIYKTEKMSDGIVIDYYDDGGAIIRDGTKTISLRKSNSLVIKDNKIYEIVDSIYVDISKQRGKALYYTNGGSVVVENNTIYYIHENSDILYQYDRISHLPDDKENLSKETDIANENVKTFEKTAVITTNEYIAVVDADKIIYDKDGKIKYIDVEVTEDKNKFRIINNTNEDLKYRIVLNEAEETTLDTQYMRYSLKYNDGMVSAATLKLWEPDDLAKALNVKGTNYILKDGIIKSQQAEDISIMLWTDYDTIPNSMQNKYFYGTIKVYAWSEE